MASGSVFDIADSVLSGGSTPLKNKDDVFSAADKVLKESNSQRVRMQKYAAADLEARQGSFAGSPYLRTSAMKVGATVGSLAARLTGHEDAANRAHRLSDAYDKAYRNLLKRQEFPGLPDSVARKSLEMGAEITAQAPVIGLAAFGGAPAIIGQAAVSTADRSYTEALDSGKAPDQAARHAIGMGVIEGGVTTAFQMLGLGGVEKVLGRSAKPALKAGVAQSLRRLGVDTASETTEELSINLAQSLFEDHVTGVKDKGWERFKATAGDVTLQTVLTTLLYSAPGEISAHGRQKLIDSRGKILQLASEGRAPTRKEWKSLGFSRFSGMTEKARAGAVDEIAGQLSDVYLSRLQEPDGPQLEIPSGMEDFVVGLAGEREASGAARSAEQAPAPTQADNAEAGAQAAPVAPEDAAQTTAGAAQAQNAPSQSAVEGVTATQPEQAPSAQEAPESATGDVMGPRKTLTDALREEVGLPELEQATPETREKWVNEAQYRIDRDPNYIGRLLNRIGTKESGTTTKIENVALGIYLRSLKNDLNALYEQSRADDPYVAEEGRHLMNDLINEINIVTDKTRKAGTEAGRALSAYAVALNEDYSLASLVAREQAEKGAPLTPAEVDSVAELAKTISSNNAKLLKYTDGVRTGSVATAIRDVNRKGGRKRPSRRLVQKKKKLRDAVNIFKSVALEGNSLADALMGESGAFNIDAIMAGVKVVDAAVDVGVTTFSEMWADVASDFKFDGARDLFKSAWDFAESEGRIQRLGIRDNATDVLLEHAKKMFRATVESGMLDSNEVVNAVTEEMAKVNRKWTRADTVDAITNTGRFTKAKKKQSTAQKAASVIRQQLKLVKELREIEGGAVPETGRNRSIESSSITELKRRISIAKENSANIISAKAKRAEESKIAKLEQQLKDIQSGNTGSPMNAPKKRDSEAVESLKNRIARAAEESPVLRQIRSDKDTAEYESSLERTLGRYDEMLRTGNVLPIKRDERTPTTAREIELKSKINKAKSEVKKRREAWAEKNKSKTQKAFGHVAKTLDTGRTMILSFDLPLMRQAASWTYSNIVKGHVRKLGEMASVAKEAAMSDEGLLRQMEEIRSDENYGEYQRMGIEFTDISSDVSSNEEMFAGGYIGAWRESGIPGLSHFAGSLVAINRAHVSILNHVRKDYADTFMNTLIQGGADNMSDVQANAIGRSINLATGRGSLGMFEEHAGIMATLFLAPKYVSSRFRVLVEMPFRLATGVGETPETRAFVAKEAALTGTGIAAFHTLAYMAKVFIGGEDPDEALPELDPRSSDFGKIVIGNTRLDPMAGLSQALVFMTRVSSGQYKQIGSGEIKALRKPWFGEGKAPGYGKFNMKDVLFGFLRSKVSPWLGSTVDVAVKEGMGGQETTATGLVAGNTIPLPFRDIYMGMRDVGVPAGTAASVMMWLGMGMQTYGDRAKGKPTASVDPYSVNKLNGS